MFSYYGPTAGLIEQLLELDHRVVLEWGCPVPYFGSISEARIATVGINPSVREFVGDQGKELDGHERRLPTLRSLGLRDWSEADSAHMRAILEACNRYFGGRPYDRWFRILDALLRPLGLTYYGAAPSACHIDLVPYATRRKWGVLGAVDRERLLDASRWAAGSFLDRSGVEALILNGRSVVEHFEHLVGQRLASTVVPEWSLPRAGRRPVRGMAYFGRVERIGNVVLARPLKVLGYNHNLQSSFGITRDVHQRISDWIYSSLRDLRR